MDKDNSVEQLRAEVDDLKEQLRNLQSRSSSSSQILTESEARLHSTLVIARTVAFVTVFVGLIGCVIYVFEKQSWLIPFLWILVAVAFGGATAAIMNLIPDKIPAATESKTQSKIESTSA